MDQVTQAEPNQQRQVLGFLDGAIKDHLHTTTRLTRARDEVDRLRRQLAVAEQTVAEAERDRDAVRQVVVDALSLAREVGRDDSR